jgi:predicted esterase
MKGPAKHVCATRRPFSRVGRLSLIVLALFACRSPGAGAAVLAARSDAQVGVAEDDSSSDAAPLPAPSAPAPPPVMTDWCLDGLSSLDQDVCYVLPPPAEGKPRRLLIYLHGIVPPQPTSPQKQKVETAVLRASIRAGAAALVPRGLRGIGPAQAGDWWAWPTAPATHAALTPSIVARWAVAKKKLEAIAGAPFDRTYLAGSSNGAYFLAALALHGDLAALGFAIDGYGAMSGGASSSGGPNSLAKLAPKAFYIGFGTYDDETRANVRSLVTALQAARWPLRVAEHPLGHGAHEVYLDEAFDFWDATGAGMIDGNAE